MRAKMAYGNRLYLGQADHRYVQAPFADQVARSGWSWGTTAFDFDNDSDLDLYVANGNVSRKSAKDYCTTFWRHDIYTGGSEPDAEVQRLFLDEFGQAIEAGVSWNGFEHNKLFVNRGGRGFTEGGFPMGVALEDDSRAVASGDLDGDGHPELVVVLSRTESAERGQGEAEHERAVVLHNRWPTGEWIGVRLGGGRNTLGATITVERDDGTELVHRVVAGDSYKAQHAPARHFGLGEGKVARVRVRWPDGKTAELRRPANARWHVVE
jgi:hypothetical protein